MRFSASFVKSPHCTKAAPDKCPGPLFSLRLRPAPPRPGPGRLHLHCRRRRRRVRLRRRARHLRRTQPRSRGFPLNLVASSHDSLAFHPKPLRKFRKSALVRDRVKACAAESRHSIEKLLRIS
ncbi:hypothetical protein GCM10007394_04410 [Salinibacterium amurskyense]|nr:hypothetical protein GCM10007394_04410 [Salinibacterium amurskyense]